MTATTKNHNLSASNKFNSPSSQASNNLIPISYNELEVNTNKSSHLNEEDYDDDDDDDDVVTSGTGGEEVLRASFKHATGIMSNNFMANNNSMDTHRLR